MARFHVGEEPQTNNTAKAKADYFSIPNDGQVKRVRFLYRNVNDIQGDSVHEVQLKSKDGVPYKKYVECLRGYNDPIDDCPLCRANYRQLSKLYIPIAEEVKDENGNVSYRNCLWERGAKYMTKMSSLIARYPDLVSHTFEIERHGAKGSKETSYDIWEVGNDNKKIEDFNEVPSALGTAILNKTAEEMNSYLNTGSFYNSNNQQQEQPKQQYDDYVPRRRVAVSDSEKF